MSPAQGGSVSQAPTVQLVEMLGKALKKADREHKVIIGIGWRVVVTTFTLNCMHMQVVVHIQHKLLTKTALLQQQQIIISPLGRNAIAEATTDFHLICNLISNEVTGEGVMLM